MKRALLFAALCLWVTGCASIKIESFYADKIIAVTPDGRMEPYPCYTVDGIFYEDGYPTFSAQLNDFERNLKSSGRKRVLIYVFGGMNSVDDTVERSRELIDSIWETSDYYPLMINWESSLFESYGDHLVFIRNGVRSYWLGPALSPFVLLADVSRAVVNLPINMVRQTAMISETDYTMPDFTDTRLLEFTEGERLQFYVGEDKGEKASFWRRALYTIALPARIISTTLIDACGKSAWDIMIHRSRAAFDIYYADEINVDINDYIPAAFAPESGSLAHLMQHLRKLQRTDSELEFTIIGHSMGPFIINEMLLLYNDVKFKNIVYMAPACTIREGVAALKPYLQQHPETMFYNLCVHSRAENEEMLEFAVLPQGSVLEWIDIYFSSQVSVDDYTMGRWWLGMLRFPRLFGDVQSRVVHKAFGISDPVTNDRVINMPQSHTDFSSPELRFWQPDFWQIPKKEK